MSMAKIMPPMIATGNGTPKWRAMSPVTYAEDPQNAACPKDSSPV